MLVKIKDRNTRAIKNHAKAIAGTKQALPLLRHINKRIDTLAVLTNTSKNVIYDLFPPAMMTIPDAVDGYQALQPVDLTKHQTAIKQSIVSSITESIVGPYKRIFQFVVGGILAGGAYYLYKRQPNEQQHSSPVVKNQLDEQPSVAAKSVEIKTSNKITFASDVVRFKADVIQFTNVSYQQPNIPTRQPTQSSPRPQHLPSGPLSPQAPQQQDVRPPASDPIGPPVDRYPYPVVPPGYGKPSSPGEAIQPDLPTPDMPAKQPIAPAPITSPNSGITEIQQRVAGVRRLPIKDSLKEYLQYAASRSQINFEISSGGQHRHGPRTGSNRHDVDNPGTIGAADGRFYVMENGQKRYLSIYNPADRERINTFIEHFTAVAPSAGIGADYMGQTRDDRGQLLHLGGPNRPGGPATNYSGQQYVGEGFRKGLSRYGRPETLADLQAWRAQQQQRTEDPIEPPSTPLPAQPPPPVNKRSIIDFARPQAAVPAPTEKTYVGDSVAVQLALAAKQTPKGYWGSNNQNPEFDFAKGAQNPKWILDKIKSVDPSHWKGRTVVLSPGYLNDPKNLATVEEQIKYLKQAGAKIQLVGGPQSGRVRPNLAHVNSDLQALAEKYQLDFLGGFQSTDGVHPAKPGQYGVQQIPSSQPTGSRLPWASLEAAPTKQQVDDAIKSGIKYFDYDPSMDKDGSIAKYIAQQGGQIVAYNRGMGNPQWGEARRSVQSTLEESLQHPGRYVHLDNTDQMAEQDKRYLIDQLYKAGKIVIPKNDVNFWTNYLKENPEYAKQIPYGITENQVRNGDPAAVAKLHQLIPGGLINMEWQKGPSAVTAAQIEAFSRQTGIPAYHMKGFEDPKFGPGGYNAIGADIYGPNTLRQIQPINPQLPAIFPPVVPQAAIVTTIPTTIQQQFEQQQQQQEEEQQQERNKVIPSIKDQKTDQAVTPKINGGPTVEVGPPLITPH